MATTMSIISIASVLAQNVTAARLRLEAVISDLESVPAGADGLRSDLTRDRKRAQAEYNAAVRAERNAAEGHSATLTTDGRWLVASATSTHVYEVMAGGCTCQAGRNDNACWHVALVAAYESLAIELGFEPPLDDTDRERSIGDPVADGLWGYGE